MIVTSFCTLDILENSELASDGDSKVVVDDRHQLPYGIPLVLEKRPKVTSLSDDLRTAQIQVNGVAVNHLHGHFDCFFKHLRVIGAELNDKGPVFGTGPKGLVAILFISYKDSSVPSKKYSAFQF